MFIPVLRSYQWNNLSNEIMTADSYISFRNAVKKIYFVTPISLPISLKDTGVSVLHARIRNNCSDLNNDLVQNHLRNVAVEMA